MKELSSILEADRNYTILLKGMDLDSIRFEIQTVELATGIEFKVVEIPKKLNDAEKQHLFNILPKNSYKNWNKEVMDYYIQRFYNLSLENMVKYLSELGIKNIDKNKLENHGLQLTKGIFNECKSLIEKDIQNRFSKDLNEGKIIATKKDDEIIFVSLEEGMNVLSPKLSMLWDESSGYSIFEFLVEVIAQNKGKVQIQKDGVKTLVISDEVEYRKLMSNGIKATVDLWGGWCHPCRLFEKELIPYLKEHPDIMLIKINTDFNEWTRKVLKEHESRGIPLVILKDGWYEYAIRGYMKGIVDTEVRKFFEERGTIE